MEKRNYTGGLGEIIDYDDKSVILPQDYLLRVPASILVEFLGRHYPYAPEKRRQQAVIGEWALESSWKVKKIQLIAPELGRAALSFSWQFQRGLASRRDLELIADIPEEERSLLHMQDAELQELAIEALTSMNSLRKQDWDAGLRFIKANYGIWREDVLNNRVHFSDPVRVHSGP